MQLARIQHHLISDFSFKYFSIFSDETYRFKKKQQASSKSSDYQRSAKYGSWSSKTTPDKKVKEIGEFFAAIKTKLGFSF
jgi:hypothetical protein